MNKIIFGITTYNSMDFLYDNLKVLLKEICKLDKYNKKVIISSNGEQNFQDVHKVINQLKETFEIIEIKLLNTKIKGKNNALNAILECCSQDDICYFIDDDIDISYNTIQSNIECLIRYRNLYNIPIIVGPNFKMKQINYNLFQKIISIPYLEEAANSPFIMGGALTFYKRDFGYYPSDENIADDGYIGNYFLKYLYDNEITIYSTNIIKDEYAYFKPCKTFLEWKQQQIRILIGVDNSYKYFGPQYENYFKSKCKWEFSFSRELQKPIKMNFNIMIYRLLQKIVLKELKRINSNQFEWENISSTKKI